MGRRRDGVAIRPGQPLLRAGCQPAGVFCESLKVVKGVDAVELAGVDQAHEQVADACAVERLVKHRVLAVQDRLFQGTLTDIMPTPGLCRVAVATDEFTVVCATFGLDDAA